MKQTLIALVAIVATAPAAFAIAYASGVKNTGGNSYEFTLNEDAANVTVIRDGEADLALGALPRGTHAFMASGAFIIEVSTAAVAGGGTWVQTSVDGVDNSYFYPRGIGINKNPASENFGDVYIANGIAGTTVVGAGRFTDDGFYRMDAAMNNQTFGNAGVTWTGNFSPYRVQVGEDDLLYVADRANSRVFEVATDLSSTVQLIDPNTTPDNPAGPITPDLFVTGTQADGDRTLYVTDSQFPSSGVTRYDLGADAAASDRGTIFIPIGSFNVYAFDIEGDSNGDFYVSSYRFTTGQEPSIRKFDPNGTLIWETTFADTTADNRGGQISLALMERLGLVAVGVGFGDSNDGFVRVYDAATGVLQTEFETGHANVSVMTADIAGNLYTGDNTTELLRVFALDGDWVTTTSSTGAFTLAPALPACLCGDVNNDGAVNAGDIDCFVQAVVSGAACDADCSLSAADTNGDNTVNAGDIDTFVAAVVNGACQ